MSRRRPYCEDWGCPPLWTCARAFGRSEAYWRFDPEADASEGLSLYPGQRKPGHEACADWERDKPRPWLAGAFEPQVPMQRPEIPEGFTIHLLDVQGRA